MPVVPAAAAPLDDKCIRRRCSDRFPVPIDRVARDDRNACQLASTLVTRSVYCQQCAQQGAGEAGGCPRHTAAICRSPSINRR